jgi:probable addiction module antidote protein/putative addiction module killer protein
MTRIDKSPAVLHKGQRRIVQTERFRDWLDGLRDRKAKVRIDDRLRRLADGNAGDTKSVGEGVRELRMHFGPGYRIYYTVRDGLLIIQVETRVRRLAILARPAGSPRKRMMALKVIPFDPARHLETADDILHYLEAAMEGNDAKHIARALGDVARSKGMSEIARKAGLGRQALYNALSDNGNPTLETLTAVLSALGLELTVQKAAA